MTAVTDNPRSKSVDVPRIHSLVTARMNSGRWFPVLVALVRRQSHLSLNARRAAVSSPPSPSRASRRARPLTSSRSAPALPRLDSRTFLRGVVERVREEIPADFSPIHSTAYSYMAQLWSGNKQLH